jgi:hypothetical protein
MPVLRLVVPINRIVPGPNSFSLLRTATRKPTAKFTSSDDIGIRKLDKSEALVVWRTLRNEVTKLNAVLFPKFCVRGAGKGSLTRLAVASL